ncbi:hypothetical protein MMC07_004012 [Pseudocyphellaria aurata]|nr:hypothetical protein [Pseudocyphellaria aurata]
MATSKQTAESIAGGCLCEKVRYTIDFPAGCQWPPDCTQCRKHSGSLVVHFITVSPSQVHWFSPGSPSPSATPLSPFKEFLSSAKARRGFCAECGTALSWRHVEVPEEIEILTGSVDEAFLIGDRTARVESKVFTETGKWEQMQEEEERDSKVRGRDLCLPKGGNFFFRNAIHGVTDMKVGGAKRWVENSSSGLVIPD